MMRQQNTNNSNNSNRRPRGRTNNNTSNRKPQQQQSRNGVFDSNGPGGRIRGNASQLKEKYLQLARDATVSGDRVLAESLHQFAEHYFRVVNDSTDPQTEAQIQAQAEAQAQPQPQPQSRHSSDQRNNQSDNYRNRNSRSNVDHENRTVESTNAPDTEIEPSVAASSHSEVPDSASTRSDNTRSRSNLSGNSSSENVNEENDGRKPTPRNRVRSRRPRYEESEVKADKPIQSRSSSEFKSTPEVPVVEAKPIAAEQLPLSVEEAPVEKPKRRPRTPKPATSEVKTPRPRGRPRKVVAKVEDDSSTETA
ncbi:MAG: DUF4167 domain-containing protein [Halopseudomonas aestusnigri]